jgi:hypothetical protein
MLIARSRIRRALSRFDGAASVAVITEAYAPIMFLGALGGAVIGWLVGRFGR